MAHELTDKTIAFVMANEGVEQIELTRPWEAVVRSGGEARAIAPASGAIRAFNHLDKADTFDVDLTTDQVAVEDFDGIVLPGGVANPDQLRTDEAAVRFIRSFFESGKPVAAICHGPWTLVEADVLEGRTLTSWPSLATDIRNAGGTWVDQEVVVCSQGPNTLVTSRKPDDLDAFCSVLITAFTQRSASSAA